MNIFRQYPIDLCPSPLARLKCFLNGFRVRFLTAELCFVKFNCADKGLRSLHHDLPLFGILNAGLMFTCASDSFSRWPFHDVGLLYLASLHATSSASFT